MTKALPQARASSLKFPIFFMGLPNIALRGLGHTKI